jgi:hypothetical protein
MAASPAASRGVLRYAGGRSRPLQFVNAINKMARTAWTLLAHGGTYRAPEPNKGARRGREEEEGYGERHRHDLEGPPRKVRRSGSAKHLCQWTLQPIAAWLVPKSSVAKSPSI